MKKKIYMNCDYTRGAHPKVLQRIVETNLEESIGYGEDEYCESARSAIALACKKEGLGIHFLVGGTQANTTVINSILRPHQAVISAESGHINVHETGSIEHGGHKILAQHSEDGKITAAQIQTIAKHHKADGSREHTVQPKMVYISHPTEWGTLYSKKELEEISRVCKQEGYYLFLDGARLAYGLTAKGSDVDLETLATYCDVFYIGGTKCGALMGEAVVIVRQELQEDFRYITKQNGALLAKGRLLGLQFEALFTNRLYEEIGSHANRLADEIRSVIDQKQIPYFVYNETNQIFLKLTKEQMNSLEEEFVISCFEQLGEDLFLVRLCTDWGTSKSAVDQLMKVMERF